MRAQHKGRTSDYLKRRAPELRPIALAAVGDEQMAEVATPRKMFRRVLHVIGELRNPEPIRC